MPRREITAGTEGPVQADLTMTGRNGTIRVTVEAGRPAGLVVDTADDLPVSPSFASVTGAGLAWENAAPQPDVPGPQEQRGRLVAQIDSEADPRDGSKVDVTVNVPPGSSVFVATETAGVEIGHGELTNVHVESREGAVRVAESADVFVHSQGEVWVGRAATVDIRSTGGPGSGPVTIGAADAIDVQAKGSDIRIGTAHGTVAAHSAQGSVTIDAIDPTIDKSARKPLRIGAPAGRVTLPDAVPAGVRVRVSDANGDRSIGDAPRTDSGPEAERTKDFSVRKRDLQRGSDTNKLGI
ncbi:hypothetical protein FB561_2799 [Kribbella amoyensis]|uniref:Adhesin n=1 Tax=Kribbella amoyensis TaxID=996641 RepID=A0A561BS89_9ACTN|nr:hypothetical protein [Kribbella amoyensis]TWD81679.1 hypothetical protein FB561_2799 [Kribbella amoyensis]